MVASDTEPHDKTMNDFFGSAAAGDEHALRAQSQVRFVFIFLVAIIVHLIVILGIRMQASQPAQRPISVDLNLRTTNDKVASQVAAQPRADTEPKPAEQATIQPNALVPKRLETPTRTQTQIANPAEPKQRATLNKSRAALVSEIAQLDTFSVEATFDNPRHRVLTNGGRLNPDEAAYLSMWRRKCERIGRYNYPTGGLQGELSMTVVILSSGALYSVEVTQSSGHPALDQAAIETVKQAAPYQPFGVEMRKKYDRLTFSRTWQFSRQGTLFEG